MNKKNGLHLKVLKLLIGFIAVLGCFRNAISAERALITYTYTVPDMASSGTEVSFDYVINDELNVGTVDLTFDWNTINHISYGTLTITSPEGTTLSMKAPINGSNSFSFSDFQNEKLKGTWVFKILDVSGNGGHTAKNVKFKVSELPLNPVLNISGNKWSAGEVQSDFSAKSPAFNLINEGNDSIVVHSVEFSGSTTFSSTLIPANVKATLGKSYSFSFYYKPQLVGRDTAYYTIRTNAGDTTIMLTGVAVKQADINFETGIIPEGWLIADTDDNLTNWAPFKPDTNTSSYRAHSGNWVLRSGYSTKKAGNWFISPTLNPTVENGKFTFWATSTSSVNLEDFYVIASIKGNTTSDFSDTLAVFAGIPDVWTKYSVDLSKYIGGKIYIAIVQNSSNKNLMYLDDIYAPIYYFDNDLAVKNIFVNVAPNVGDVVEVGVVLKNTGTLSQSKFTLAINNSAGQLIKSLVVASLQPGVTDTIYVPVTFSSTGKVEIYASAELSSDQDISNNKSLTKSVYVQKEGTVSNKIGSDSKLSNFFPFGLEFPSYLCEQLYYPEELNGGGYIQALQYFYSATTNVPGKKFRVWMGTTTYSNLSAGWIGSDNLTLVFDGELKFSEGMHPLHIQLDKPFLYQNKNLVVMIEHYGDSTFLSNILKFYTSESASHPSRSRALYSNKSISSIAPATGGLLKATIPNVQFFFNSNGLGSVSGKVTTADQPLAGVNVSLTGTDFNSLSGTDGTYSLNYLTPGIYNLNASIYGYYNVPFSIQVHANTQEVKNIAMQTRDKVSIKGHVVKSDVPDQPLVGAEINMSGYETYKTSSDSEGNFLLNDVWAGTEYSLKITADNCSAFERKVQVSNTTIDLGTLVINEVTHMPGEVIAELSQDSQVNISWYRGNNRQRGFENYSVFRFLNGNESDTSLWTAITLNTSDTAAIDANLKNDNAGIYYYAVVANYSNKVVSTASLSNSIAFNMEVPVNIRLYSASGDSFAGAKVSLINRDGDFWHKYNVVANQNDSALFSSVWRGTYILKVEYPGYATWVDSNLLIINNENNLSLELLEVITAPVNLQVEYTESDNILLWQTVNSSVINRSPKKFRVFLNDTLSSIGDTTGMAYSLGNLTEGTEYLAGVSSVYDAGISAISTIRFTVPDFGSLSVNVTANSGDSMEGALVELQENENGSQLFSGLTDVNSELIFSRLPKDGYILSVQKAGYSTYVDSAFAFSQESDSVNVLLTEKLEPVVEIKPLFTSISSIVSWNKVTLNRAFQKYKVYLHNFETPVAETMDTLFDISSMVNKGDTVNVGVEVVYTTGVSEMLKKNMVVPYLATVQFEISANAGSVEGAELLLTGEDAFYHFTFGTDGKLSIPNIAYGGYSLQIYKGGFVSINRTLSIISDSLIQVLLLEYIAPVYNPKVSIDNNSVLFSWNNGLYHFNDDFEEGNLSQQWTLVKGNGTTSSGGHPYWYVSNEVAASGKQALVCDWGTNINTWLISPDIFIDEQGFVSFSWYSDYAWSVYPNNNSDLWVKASTDGGSSWKTLWTYGEIGEWDSYKWNFTTLSLSEFAGQTVKVAFHLVGNDNSMNAIDGVSVGNTVYAAKPAVEEREFKYFRVYLDDWATPIDSTDNTSFVFEGLEGGKTYTAGVSSVYSSGESELAKIQFQAPVSVLQQEKPTQCLVYPNPAHDVVSVETDFSVSKISLFTPDGKLVSFINPVNNQFDVSGLEKGVYILSILGEKKISNAVLNIQ